MAEIILVDNVLCQISSNVPKYIKAFESIGFSVKVDTNSITDNGVIHLEVYKTKKEDTDC